jgi:uncharacterized membrane protein YhaH (DUF805 family)
MQSVPPGPQGSWRAPITFVDAIALGFKKFVDFRGVSRRSEYWYWVLFTVLIGMVTATLDNGVATAIPGFTALNDVTSIALFLPTLAVAVRRFRDAGYSPWLLLLQIVPVFVIAGVIISAAISATPFLSQYSEAELDSMVTEFVDKGTGPLLAAIENGVFDGALGFALIAMLITLALGIWQLVILCRPTKTFEQGNKRAIPAAGQPVQADYPSNSDDGGTTS